MANIVEQATKAQNKRITYGIAIKVDGVFDIDEWGLREHVAKQVHEMLLANGDEPFSLGSMTFSRRETSALSAALAELQTKLSAPSV